MYRVANRGVVAGRYLQRRLLSFNLPTISQLETLKSTEQDFQGLWSNRTVNELWFKRGEQLISGLNGSIEQSNVSDSTTSSNLPELISQTINHPELYGVYAYSALLYNLQFSLESLKQNTNGTFGVSGPEELLKTPTDEFSNIPQNDKLVSWINHSFGSIVEFRTLLLNSAKAIKGDGYVWLVAESNLSQSVLRNSPNIAEPGTSKQPIYSNLAIVNTYNVGVVEDSIRSGQMNRLKQQKDAKLAALKQKQKQRQEEQELVEEIEEEKQGDNLTLGSVEEAEFNSLYNDKKLLPLLAIDASQRAYLLDYGVFGKQQYLDNVWECIDWDIVANRLPERTKQFIH